MASPRAVKAASIVSRPPRDLDSGCDTNDPINTYSGSTPLASNPAKMSRNFSSTCTRKKGRSAMR